MSAKMVNTETELPNFKVDSPTSQALWKSGQQFRSGVGSPFNNHGPVPIAPDSLDSGKLFGPIKPQEELEHQEAKDEEILTHMLQVPIWELDDQ